MARIAGVNIPNHKHAEIALNVRFTALVETLPQKAFVLAAGVLTKCSK